MDICDLPSSIQLVWHGVNDALNLRQFLASDVTWAELDINLDPAGRRLILRHDSFEELPRWDGEPLLYLEDALPRLLDRGKSIKLDFKAGGRAMQEALQLVDRSALTTDRLWLNADLEILAEIGVRAAAERYPRAILQAPLHSIDARLDDLDRLEPRLSELAGAGMNRFSVGWQYPDVPGIVRQMREWGYATNIYGVADLDEFLGAVELMPDAITADFNFPAWGYYGRGAGHRGRYHAYEMVMEGP